jgi:steroid delta-isomerase-like uncharacterized protein
MSVKENKAIICQLLEETYSKGNLAVGDKLVAQHVVLHNPDMKGIESWKQFATMWRTAFPDLRITADDIIAEEDKVVAIWTARGTHQGSFQGIAPTGKQVTVTGVAIYRFSGNKIEEMWGWRDALGLMQQLGVIPSTK